MSDTPAMAVAALWRRALVDVLVAGLLIAVGAAASCGSAKLMAADAATRLRLATFSCDVTPPLGGHPLIWITPAETVEDPLLAKGVIIEHDGQRYVLCAMDWCGLCNSTHRLLRDKIAAAAAAQPRQVALHTVHQHTAPYTDGDAQKLLDQTSNPPRYVDQQFIDQLAQRLSQTVRESVGRLQPFDAVGIGQARVEQVASSRRIVVQGKLHVRMSSAKNAVLWALPEGDIDPMLKTITLAAGDRPLVRLHFYATHPQSFYGDARVSADVPGLARQRLQKKENVPQIYFTGCAGDVAMGKYNDGTPQARDELTERLFKAMEAAASATRYQPVGQFQWRSVPLKLPLREDRGYTLEDALARLADQRLAPVDRVRAATRAAFALRADQPLEVASMRLGNVWMVFLPGECMLEFQRFAQQVRPEDFVAVTAYGDLGPGYICTEKTFAEGGYEPTASHVAPRSEALLKAAIKDLLE
jgi:hypothetical protein